MFLQQTIFMNYKKATLFLLIVFLSAPVFAQKVEIGSSLGVMHYKGDITPRFRPFDVRGGGNVFFRYNPNRSISYKASFLVGSISGKDSRNSDFFQRERNFEFQTNIKEIGTQLEYNFLNFRQGYSNYRKDYTPYLFAGLSYLNFQPKYKSSDYKTTGFVIPFGVGFKSVLTGQWNWGFEFGTRKTFTDYMDDLGIVDNQDKLLQGNPAMKDMYYFTNLSISYTFYKVSCPK
jgi:hypothetical protein